MPAKSQASERLAQFVIEQLAMNDPIVTRPLFGAIGLYRNGQVFAMAWKGSLYFKVDEATRKDYEAAHAACIGRNRRNLEVVSMDSEARRFWENHLGSSWGSAIPVSPGGCTRSKKPCHLTSIHGSPSILFSAFVMTSSLSP